MRVKKRKCSQVGWPVIPGIGIGLPPLGIGHVVVSAILVYQYPIVRTVLSNIVTLAPTQRSAVLWASFIAAAGDFASVSAAWMPSSSALRTRPVS